MPLTAESMIQQVPGPSLASGAQLPSSQPHPLIRELWTKCPSSSADEVEHLLKEIGPLPPVDDIPAAALHCLREAVLRSAYNPDRGVLGVLLRHGFSTYKLSCQLVDKAFGESNTRTLAALIEGGWDVNEAGPGMAARPLLRHAVNDAEMRRFLLRHGADPLVENERRLTALETAAGWSSTQVLEELIAHGGDPRRDDSLLHAVESGRLDNARVLVAHGADVNQLEKVYPHPWGQAPRRTPLDVATARCPPSETSVAPHPQVEALWKKGVEMRDWLISQGATQRNSETSR
ncbi:hypothetical protein ACRE_025930 [Hapsidospora chrysogenum ATCC 11550]|uniref:Uncharacterized protein n=1 Tax=Hapsidospora chrysogenum (strain ATCC 11550 / CBS 779.69 / DSM 880 / IAM 14645 / JCM 23072 / IMI 49137) TaxID=857340 RepID=A0A086TB34_HAPC1|nr:hypothetical protein ACRE_025930 [Hapsidospora chrysogenum ATCC 11550]